MQSPESTSVRAPTTRVQVSEKFFFWLDEPANWDLKVRQLRLSGWCVARKGAPVTHIRALVRGQIFPGRFDRERPEVAAHVGRPTAPHWCGFTLDVCVPFGKARLEVQVARADQSWQKAYARDVRGPWSVGAAERALWQQTDAADAARRYAFFVDQPSDWQKPTRTIYITGWCVDRFDDGIAAMCAVVDGQRFRANYGIARPSVAAGFPEAKHAERSGFAIAAEIPPGRHTLQLQVKDERGVWHPLLTEEVNGKRQAQRETELPPPEDETLFTPSAESTSRFRFWFDRPSDWSTRTRHLHISGWCFAQFGDEIHELRARVRGKEFRANYGIIRPDVAATFEAGLTALRSGFSIDLVLPWGRSHLVLEGRSKDGPWEEFFATSVRGAFRQPRRRIESEAVGDYAEWIRLYDTVRRRDRSEIARAIAGFTNRPTFSILLPAYNSNPKWLRQAIASVRKQLYPHWELCLVDDASTAPEVWEILQRAARRDSRIKVRRRETNGHISAASNDALALATGDFVALLDHDDELAPTALYFAVAELNRAPSLQLLYSDEDKLDRQGRRCDPYFKTDWNPDLFTAQNYISHLSFYATDLVRKAGGFRVGLEGSQDYDLTLRCLEQIQPAQIRHIPHVLYHWRSAEQSTATFGGAKPYAHAAAVRAMQEHFDRRQILARVEPHYANYLRVRYPLPAEAPLVSIIIPTRDRVALLCQTIDSLLAQTDYPNFEILILDNESVEIETRAYLDSLGGRTRVLSAPGEFNYSRLNNFGVAHARGSVVALLNNDLEVKNRDWLHEMVSHVLRPGVGAVGARLWYPDGTIQHGGVLLGVGGVATHAHGGLRHEHGYFARAHLTQNFSAVTGACMVVTRAIYEQVGGLDEENLAVAFNDVDFCLRLREGGWRIVWTPHAEFIHHESASRGLEDTGAKQRRFLSEVAFMRGKWSDVLENDPFYNPNLSLESNQQFRLAFPPRVVKPWRETAP
ncbi:MAG TPA: glycosyltransferase family 2 protein [Chthoniobacterales bacterium]|nr:glycosyltransferase family 2 protein [Chthoniobacterales bacterium]